MKKYIFFILFYFVYNLYSDSEININQLIYEYHLLYIDLINIDTIGYKSHFNKNYNRASDVLNISQAPLIETNNYFDCAIIGEGFFKIKLENDMIGYTRAGNFKVDENNNLITSQGYHLYNNINLGLYVSESLKILKNGEIFINTINENNEIVEFSLGRLLTYSFDYNNLLYYNNNVYLLKNNIEYNEEIIYDNSIMQKHLELSNSEYLPIILRMYYILFLLNETEVEEKEFKMDLLRFLLNNIDNRYVLYDVLPYLKFGI